MKITHLPFDGDFKITWPYGAIGKFAGTNDDKHHGIDLVGITNKNVFATCEGVVNFAGYDPSGFGNYVKIVEDATGLAHYFAHLESINVKVNQRVTYTTKLGVMGSTGNVTGPHTHYEIRRNGVHIDPTPYMRIPNVLGTYNAKNYLIELNPPVVVTQAPVKTQPVQPQYKHKVGQLKTYSSVYKNANDPISKAYILKSWQRDFIADIIPGARNPYKLRNGWFINDGDIRG